MMNHSVNIGGYFSISFLTKSCTVEGYRSLILDPSQIHDIRSTFDTVKNWILQKLVKK